MFFAERFVQTLSSLPSRLWRRTTTSSWTAAGRSSSSQRRSSSCRRRRREDDHLALLGVLNSSTACFWLKQNSHNKGDGGIGGGIGDESWEPRYEFTGTTLQDFPLPRALPLELARRARLRPRRMAQERFLTGVPSDGCDTDSGHAGARPDRHLLDARAHGRSAGGTGLGGLHAPTASSTRTSPTTIRSAGGSPRRARLRDRARTGSGRRR